ncbi:hypothetical protein DY000_02045643 [Brassica cretica]|uniref:FLZ-type domain-containing protein n=1 Tax=Brassica cretica TaxID=69181 RepID=A0ABQ7EZ22_BRACR|nr:hypothetical protein DY000_02045643 [Brassica cretica]
MDFVSHLDMCLSCGKRFLQSKARCQSYTQTKRPQSTGIKPQGKLESDRSETLCRTDETTPTLLNPPLKRFKLTIRLFFLHVRDAPLKRRKRLNNSVETDSPQKKSE